MLSAALIEVQLWRRPSATRASEQSKFVFQHPTCGTSQSLG